MAASVRSASAMRVARAGVDLPRLLAASGEGGSRRRRCSRGGRRSRSSPSCAPRVRNIAAGGRGSWGAAARHPLEPSCDRVRLEDADPDRQEQLAALVSRRITIGTLEEGSSIRPFTPCEFPLLDAASRDHSARRPRSGQGTIVQQSHSARTRPAAASFLAWSRRESARFRRASLREAKAPPAGQLRHRPGGCVRPRNGCARAAASPPACRAATRRSARSGGSACGPRGTRPRGSRRSPAPRAPAPRADR